MNRRQSLPGSMAELSTLMLFSPLVMSARMTQFWLSAASPTTRDKAEAARMVTEKLQAAAESVLAMNLAVGTAAADMALAAVTGRMRHVNDADAVLKAGLRPFTRRVRANHRRLSK
ncbi:hypothetical protein [Mangrovicella endophytica]|uniref:hypothetical protein n=1 Tax=Mangrovicella endophytica TaxID=2066697 RepID=UPI0012FFE3EF|nr:hypothetical protein [Mangrovicella endophytica]